jgi:hypothetical protein
METTLLERVSGYAMISDELVWDMRLWRHEFHSHPETAFEEHRTARRIAELLHSFGLQVTTGIGGTGVVGTLRAGKSSCRIPDDHLSKRIWKLALAREGMGMLLQSLRQQQQ